MRKLLLSSLLILSVPSIAPAKSGKRNSLAPKTLVGTTWKIEENIVKWEKSEMSPITFLLGGKVKTANGLKLVWKQSGNKIEIRDTEMGWPEIWATLKGTESMTGSARLGQGAREFGWRANRLPASPIRRNR